MNVFVADFSEGNSTDFTQLSRLDIHSADVYYKLVFLTSPFVR